MQGAIPFPNISPEIFSFTVFGFEVALRWYAMGYIVGIALGWQIIKAALKRPHLWRNGAPMEVSQLEDLLTYIVVGVIGGNGAGKSTLFRMMMGQEQPDSGSIDIGETVEMAYVDQSRDDLDGEKTVFQTLSGGADNITIGNYEMPARNYVGRFNFKGADQQKMVKDLSGGERGRLHLALTLKQGANVLLLDEPSNDLDVETLRALEEALLDFAGCAVVISHDRWFLDRVATHILAYEDPSEINFFAGNYTEYEADRR